MINILLLLLFELSSAYNITQCNQCIKIIDNIKNSNSVTKYLHYLDDFCKITNNTKCETYITDIDNNIKHMNTSDICYELEYCDRLNFKSIVMVTQGGMSSSWTYNVSLPSKCKLSCPLLTTPYIGLSYFKYYNKLIVMYDSNSYDKTNCYKYIDNKGIIKLEKIWEIDFDSDKWEIEGTTWAVNINNPYSFCDYNTDHILPYILIVATDNYRHYILNNGTIFKKIKLNRGVHFHPGGAFSPYNSLPSNQSTYNNETYISNDDTLYSIKYIVEPETYINGCEQEQINVCRIKDIEIKKVFSF